MHPIRVRLAATAMCWIALALPAQAQPRQEPRLTPQLMASFSEHFKDPGSVQVRGVNFSRDGREMCGYVNARNGYGGYTGFRPFTAALTHGRVAYVETLDFFIPVCN